MRFLTREHNPGTQGVHVELLQVFELWGAAVDLVPAGAGRAGVRGLELLIVQRHPAVAVIHADAREAEVHRRARADPHPTRADGLRSTPAQLCTVRAYVPPTPGRR